MAFIREHSAEFLVCFPLIHHSCFNNRYSRHISEHHTFNQHQDVDDARVSRIGVIVYDRAITGPPAAGPERGVAGNYSFTLI